MFITAMYLYGIIQGAFAPTWWVFLVAFFADLVIAGTIGSRPAEIMSR